jgi:hypothetical protein
VVKALHLVNLALQAAAERIMALLEEALTVKELVIQVEQADLALVLIEEVAVAVALEALVHLEVILRMVGLDYQIQF